MRSARSEADGEARPRARQRRRRGFSIIELVVVMVMMGIIAAMAVPRLNYDRYRADGAMRVVKTVLAGAQRNAIMRQTNMLVIFDEAHKNMQILEDANNNCAYDSGERMTNHPLEEGARFLLPPTGYGGTVPTASVSGPNTCTVSGLPAVAFLRDGAASTDLDVYLTSARPWAGDFRMVHLTQATGRAETRRYTGSTWVRFN